MGRGESSLSETGLPQGASRPGLLLWIMIKHRTRTQSHRLAEVGIDPGGPLVDNDPRKQGHLELAAQDCDQMACECPRK